MNLRNLAALSGFSKSTVSSALRGETGVSAATKRHIEQIARRENYALDPVTSHLMSSMARARLRVESTPLVLLGDFPLEALWTTRRADLGRCVKAMRARAEQLGYRVDIVSLRQPGMTPAHLAKMLRTRATRGVIVLGEPDVALPWELALPDVTCVSWGNRRNLACGTVAAPDDHAAMQITLRVLKQRGYVRPALILTGTSPREWDWRAAFQLEHEAAAIWTPSHESRREPGAWLRAFRPDALIVPNATVARNLVAAGGVSEPPGLVLLEKPPGRDEFAGIDPRFDYLGARLVDLVSDQMKRPNRATTGAETLLLPGRWSEGASLPWRRAASQAAG